MESVDKKERRQDGYDKSRLEQLAKPKAHQDITAVQFPIKEDLQATIRPILNTTLKYTPSERLLELACPKSPYFIYYGTEPFRFIRRDRLISSEEYPNGPEYVLSFLPALRQIEATRPSAVTFLPFLRYTKGKQPRLVTFLSKQERARRESTRKAQCSKRICNLALPKQNNMGDRRKQIEEAKKIWVTPKSALTAAPSSRIIALSRPKVDKHLEARRKVQMKQREGVPCEKRHKESKGIKSAPTLMDKLTSDGKDVTKQKHRKKEISDISKMNKKGKSIAASRKLLINEQLDASRRPGMLEKRVGKPSIMNKEKKQPSTILKKELKKKDNKEIPETHVESESVISSQQTDDTGIGHEAEKKKSLIFSKSKDKFPEVSKQPVKPVADITKKEGKHPVGRKERKLKSGTTKGAHIRASSSLISSDSTLQPPSSSDVSLLEMESDLLPMNNIIDHSRMGKDKQTTEVELKVSSQMLTTEKKIGMATMKVEMEDMLLKSPSETIESQLELTEEKAVEDSMFAAIESEKDAQFSTKNGASEKTVSERSDAEIRASPEEGEEGLQLVSEGDSVEDALIAEETKDVMTSLKEYTTGDDTLYETAESRLINGELIIRKKSEEETGELSVTTREVEGGVPFVSKDILAEGAFQIAKETDRDSMHSREKGTIEADTPVVTKVSEVEIAALSVPKEKETKVDAPLIPKESTEEESDHFAKQQIEKGELILPEQATDAAIVGTEGEAEVGKRSVTSEENGAPFASEEAIIEETIPSIAKETAHEALKRESTKDTESIPPAQIESERKTITDTPVGTKHSIEEVAALLILSKQEAEKASTYISKEGLPEDDAILLLEDTKAETSSYVKTESSQEGKLEFAAESSVEGVAVCTRKGEADEAPSNGAMTEGLKEDAAVAEKRADGLKIVTIKHRKDDELLVSETEKDIINITEESIIQEDTLPAVTDRIIEENELSQTESGSVEDNTRFQGKESGTEISVPTEDREVHLPIVAVEGTTKEDASLLMTKPTEDGSLTTQGEETQDLVTTEDKEGNIAILSGEGRLEKGIPAETGDILATEEEEQAALLHKDTEESLLIVKTEEKVEDTSESDASVPYDKDMQGLEVMRINEIDGMQDTGKKREEITLDEKALEQTAQSVIEKHKLLKTTVSEEDKQELHLITASLTSVTQNEINNVGKVELETEAIEQLDTVESTDSASKTVDRNKIFETEIEAKSFTEPEIAIDTKELQTPIELYTGGDFLQTKEPMDEHHPTEIHSKNLKERKGEESGEKLIITKIKGLESEETSTSIDEEREKKVKHSKAGKKMTLKLEKPKPTLCPSQPYLPMEKITIEKMPLKITNFPGPFIGQTILPVQDGSAKIEYDINTEKTPIVKDSIDSLVCVAQPVHETSSLQNGLAPELAIASDQLLITDEDQKQRITREEKLTEDAKLKERDIGETTINAASELEALTGTDYTSLAEVESNVPSRYKEEALNELKIIALKSESRTTQMAGYKTIESFKGAESYRQEVYAAPSEPKHLIENDKQQSQEISMQSNIKTIYIKRDEEKRKLSYLTPPPQVIPAKVSCSKFLLATVEYTESL